VRLDISCRQRQLFAFAPSGMKPPPQAPRIRISDLFFDRIWIYRPLHRPVPSQKSRKDTQANAKFLEITHFHPLVRPELLAAECDHLSARDKAQSPEIRKSDFSTDKQMQGFKAFIFSLQLIVSSQIIFPKTG
jgi:hypothetical protein